MAEQKLKPCPFCGSTDLYIFHDHGHNWQVICDCYVREGCGASGGYRHSREEAIEAWNTRVRWQNE